jgi:hypothetical protein
MDAVNRIRSEALVAFGIVFDAKVLPLTIGSESAKCNKIQEGC